VRPLRCDRAGIVDAPRPAVDPTSVRVEQVSATAGRMPALERFAGIDRANAERLKRGLHRIEARLGPN